MPDHRRLSIFAFVVSLASLCATACFGAARGDSTETARQEEYARAVTIVRDDWGIAHIYGKTDAGAVFGMIYAQAEDDFNRVENNYLLSLGVRKVEKSPFTFYARRLPIRLPTPNPYSRAPGAFSLTGRQSNVPSEA